MSYGVDTPPILVDRDGRDSVGGAGVPAVACAPLLDREALLRRSTRAAHRGVALDDDVAWIRVSVRVRLHAAARVVLDVERVHVALLLGGACVLVLVRPPPLAAGALAQLLVAHAPVMLGRPGLKRGGRARSSRSRSRDRASRQGGRRGRGGAA